MLNFKKEGMKKLHFFDTGLEHIIVIASYTDEELEIMMQVEDVFLSMGFLLEEIIEWCEEHDMVYQVIPFFDVAEDDYLNNGGYTGVGG